MKKAAIITGASGAIGQALVQKFARKNYMVIASDKVDPPRELECDFVLADLEKTVTDLQYARTIFDEIRGLIKNNLLKILINNAAIQILGKVEELTHTDWQTTLNTNLLAPFFWTQQFLPELATARGCVINISSIHSRLTKQNFTAYATSKAALSGLTRSLAVELGGRVRINAIEPAAIDTPMLRKGFKDNLEGLNQLKNFHPTSCIGKPDEVAELALMMANENLQFMNGSIIGLDGGIGGCLSDPG